MKVLITGKEGQLGRELCKLLPESLCYGHKASDFTKSLDITSPEKISQEIAQHAPDVIINASAMTNVDHCEIDRNKAMGINGTSLKHITAAARKTGAYLVHISTDYVFDGSEGNYGELSPPNPINYYGLSKLIGDIYSDSYEKSLIVRTSGVFGHSNNFPRFAYEKLRRNETLHVLDGYYSPIHACFLAKAIVELLQLKPTGILNVAGEKTSRLNLANKIADMYGLDSGLIQLMDKPIEFKAKRPHDSSLNIDLAKSMIAYDFFSLDKNLDLLGSL